MPSISKILDRLDVRSLSENPVWEFCINETDYKSDRRVFPVTSLPVNSLTGRIVGTQVRLKNGTDKWAVISNLTLTNIKKSKHFLTIWIENKRKWFGLARYFDVDYKRRGPQQLADFLGLDIKAVFPISYDISSVVQGDPAIVIGQIEEFPQEKLTDDELIELTLADD